MKQKHVPYSFPAQMSGFTLIEFLVASALALIVIMAASGSYFLTRQLSHTVQQRLNIQQNLRNASTQIMRDARMVGTFGCYNTGSIRKGDYALTADSDSIPVTDPQFNDVSNADLRITAQSDGGFGIRELNKHGKKWLVFIYGVGDSAVKEVKTLSDTSSTSNIDTITVANTGDANTDALYQALTAKGDVILSSCYSAYGFKANNVANSSNNSTIRLNKQLPLKKSDGGSLTLSKLYAAAYAHDPATKQLLRMELGSDGQWQSPQLVSTGITAMQVRYGYADCDLTQLSDASKPSKAETFTYTNTIENTSNIKTYMRLPAVVQFVLTYETNLPADVANPATVATPEPATTAQYVINATVRTGNLCGGRIPMPS